MTEQKETTKPTKPLTLSTTARSGAAAAKGGETQVRQKFSHGRTRPVTVEVKKPVRRPVGSAAATSAPEAAPAAPTGRTLKLGAGAPAAAPRAPAPTRPAAPEVRSPSGRGIVLKTLTEEEKEARTRALVGADRDAVVARQRAAEDAKRRAAEDAQRQKADDEHKKRLAEEETRKKTEDEVKRRADALVQKRLDQAAGAAPQTPVARQAQEIETGAPSAGAPGGPIRRPMGAPGAGPGGALRRSPMRPAVNKRLPQPPGARREGPKRRSDKIDVGRAVEGENDFRARSRAQQQRRLERDRRREHADDAQQKVYREVTIPETITVQELASRMSERGADVIKTLMGMGVMATINQAIDPDTAELVVTEMGHRPKRVTEGDVETGLTDTTDAAGHYDEGWLAIGTYTVTCSLNKTRRFCGRASTLQPVSSIHTTGLCRSALFSCW